jgi:hypothetical protein
MPRPYALNIPSPRTVIATLLRPLLERLVLWYLRDIAAQQSEVNAEVIRRITSLESDLRQDFKAALDGQVPTHTAPRLQGCRWPGRLSTLRQDFKAVDGQVARRAPRLQGSMARSSAPTSRLSMARSPLDAPCAKTSRLPSMARSLDVRQDFKAALDGQIDATLRQDFNR